MANLLYLFAISPKTTINKDNELKKVWPLLDTIDSQAGTALPIIYWEARQKSLGGISLTAWDEKNPEKMKGLHLYVFDSEDRANPIWEILNQNLRKNEGKLLPNSEDHHYRELILNGMDGLPKVSGIVFRGRKMRPETWKELLTQTETQDHAFVSTSFSPRAAKGFAKINKHNPDDKGRIQVLYIIRLQPKSATPVSGIDFQTSDEFEALLKPGQKFKIHTMLRNAAIADHAIIVMTQLE